LKNKPGLEAQIFCYFKDLTLGLGCGLYYIKVSRVVPAGETETLIVQRLKSQTADLLVLEEFEITESQIMTNLKSRTGVIYTQCWV